MLASRPADVICDRQPCVALPGAGVSAESRMLEEAPARSCGRCSSILKPDVVMFGEFLPEDDLARATELATSASLLLVVGSSLEVYPVAGLPQQTLAAGGSLAIVNQGPTAF